jgi:hypothetical protein
MKSQKDSLMAVRLSWVLSDSNRLRGLEGAHADWLEHDDLMSALKTCIGVLGDGDYAKLPPRCKLALAQATNLGWLLEEEYDGWRPGMESGTGMTSRYTLTPLGRKVVIETGGSKPPTRSAT